ncbi:MAG: VWA domain-containing protein [Candidatus Acidiferrum sp.]
MLQPKNYWHTLAKLACCEALTLLLCLSNSGAMPSPQQSPPTPDPASKTAQSQPTTAELTASDNQSIIRVRVPVVVIRVVVKDAAGNIVNDLKKDNFQIQDNNTPREISTFAVEHPASRTVPNRDDTGAQLKENATTVARPAVIAVPGRYVALLLDDIHIQLDAAVAVRSQAMDVIRSLHSEVLVAVFSTSGHIQEDFTTDRQALSQAISRFIPAPMIGGNNGSCPYISYFQAQLMVDLRDQDATEKAVNDFWACKYGKLDQNYPTAVRDATQTARNIVDTGDVELDQAMRRINEIVTRLSGMPGDRAIVFVSPGFASLNMVGRLSPVLDNAIRANVVVNTVDARSLYVPDASLDASLPGPCMAGSMNPTPSKGGCSPESGSRFQATQQSAMNEVLAGLALGTGGTWFHNRNDLNKGIHDALSSPVTSYVLSFSPTVKALDDKYHTLKVVVADSRNLTVQARAGYFAAKPASDPLKQAESDFRDALFAQDEMNEIPVDVHSSFFLKQSDEASLTVLTHIDIKGLHFRKVSDRNCDELTVGVVVFDDHGNFVTGNKRVLTLRLLDESLQRLRNTGVSVKMTFDIKPGTYVIRVVTSDSASMSARNGGVLIPN